MPKKPTTFSMRMPEDINDRIQAYAAEHECTKAEAMSHFVRAGIALEDGDGSEAGAGTDLSDIKRQLAEIRDSGERGLEQSVDAAAQRAAASAVERYRAEHTQTIVPVDIRDRIEAYSKEHGCTDEESLGYYARLGVSVSAEERPARAADMEELSKKLDAIVRDGAAKTEQLHDLAQTVEKIRGYTEPETVEVEGELADPAIEDARDALEEERREAARDERTKRIISETMDSYLTMSQARQPQQTQATVIMVVLVAAVVVLVVGVLALLVLQR